MARALRAWAINQRGKNSVRNLQYGPGTRLVRGIHSRFIWLNRSMSLIRAETERHDIVGFSKVTTKSLASGTGS